MNFTDDIAAKKCSEGLVYILYKNPVRTVTHFLNFTFAIGLTSHEIHAYIDLLI